MKLKRLAVAMLSLALLTGCGAQSHQTDFFAMNTVMSVQVLTERSSEKNAQTLAAEAEQRLNALDRLLSRTRAESDVSGLNNADGAARTLPQDAVTLLADAVALAAQTDGAYDPTVAPLTDLWGIGTEEARVPTKAEIAAARQRVGYQSIVLQGTEVRLADGAQLDLGGIAKGFAADECAALLREANAAGLLSLGGNIYAVGTNRGAPWKIGIANPDNPQEYIATVEISDLSVVTTGDYERFFEENGKRYHHVFDPATGYPAETDVRGVTVLGTKSTACDAYATALFIMGLEKGLAFCEENDIAAIFTGKDQTMHASSAVETVCEFEVTSEDYVNAG